MARKFTGGKLVIATHNKGKVKEIAALMEGHIDDYVMAGDLGLPEPEETEDTFVGNAILKAFAAASASGLPALADDSGFCVVDLNNDPGVYSARWAGPERDFLSAMHKVNDALADSPTREAYFICVLALAWPDGHVETVEGRVDGTAIWPPRGPMGFGYDPMFVPAGETRTFAEMAPAEKQEISHRARAFQALIRQCF